MPDVENRVEFGISEIHVADYTYNGTTVMIGTPTKIAGAISFEPDVSTNETKHFADNVVYFSEITETGRTASLNMTLFPDSFKEKYLGYKRTADGALVEVANPERKPFVLLFQGEGDAAGVRHVWYNCKPGPIQRSHATIAEQKTIETEVVDLTIVGTDDLQMIHAVYRKGNAAYETLKATIPVPAFPAEP